MAGTRATSRQVNKRPRSRAAAGRCAWCEPLRPFAQRLLLAAQIGLAVLIVADALQLYTRKPAKYGGHKHGA